MILKKTTTKPVYCGCVQLLPYMHGRFVSPSHGGFDKRGFDLYYDPPFPLTLVDERVSPDKAGEELAL